MNYHHSIHSFTSREYHTSFKHEPFYPHVHVRSRFKKSLALSLSMISFNLPHPRQKFIHDEIVNQINPTVRFVPRALSLCWSVLAVVCLWRFFSELFVCGLFASKSIDQIFVRSTPPTGHVWRVHLLPRVTCGIRPNGCKCPRKKRKSRNIARGGQCF